jgi:hypothetical protein
VRARDGVRPRRGGEGGETWTNLVYEGGWFTPLRHALDAFVDTTQELVTGEVRLELPPGAAVVTGRRSEHALYAEKLASYGEGETFPHAAADLPYDCEATLVHARRLHAAGLLSDEELAEARETLARIGPEDLEPGDEDIHSAIEGSGDASMSVKP